MANHSAAQQQPLPVRTTYVLARLTQIVQRLLEEALKPYALTLPQYTILTVLRRRPGLSNAQLARRAYITPQSMQEVLQGLESKGIVVRNAAPENRRIRLASLTASGSRLVDKVEEGAAQVDEMLLGALTPHERRVFVKALQKCVIGLGGGLNTQRPKEVRVKIRSQNG